MLNKAIVLIEKQLELYKIQDNNIVGLYSKNTIEYKVKTELKEQVKIRRYILKILKERREQDAKEKRRQSKK